MLKLKFISSLEIININRFTFPDSLTAVWTQLAAFLGVLGGCGWLVVVFVIGAAIIELEASGFGIRESSAIDDDSDGAVFLTFFFLTVIGCVWLLALSLSDRRVESASSSTLSSLVLVWGFEAVRLRHVSAVSFTVADACDVDFSTSTSVCFTCTW